MMNNNSKQHSTLYQALLALVEPVVNNLDCMVGQDEGDSGQARPSQRDMGLRIVIGGIAQNAHNQLYGEIVSSNSQKLPNVKQRLDESEERVSKIGDRLENDMLTNTDMRAIEWLRVNEARFAFCQELLSAASTLYSDITGEQWKPYVRSTEEKAKKGLSANEKAKMMALIKQKQQKAPPVEATA